MKKNLAIILAGGLGSRLDGILPKQFFLLAGKTILQHSFEKFENHPGIDHIIIVIHGDYLDRTQKIIVESGCKKIINVLKGGETRQDSSRIGVTAISPGHYENILIHDAARPLVSKEIIDNILAALDTHSAVNVAIPSPDTIIEIDPGNYIKNVPDRAYLRKVQTPQAFKLELIRQAHHLALENNITNATDDCSLVLKLNLAPVYVVPGSEKNIKITYPLDLQLAQNIYSCP
ncbi:MAG: 2-C-methyl-D-erythritol 4-phosphate cytidylyltransferase [Acidobacteria bacterium]|jgi:2-C-methyl-D-erythritol 4-phosphate cytidylyltransferase|nr:2-C-methyl-D-erythritol 4-phosphate cytidylyltransferase [Acidobacteriota bacterium]